MLTAVQPAGRTLTVVAQDSTGAIGEESVYVGVPFDPPSGLTASLGSGGTSAALQWQAPSSTGGSPIAGYTVVTQPATSTVNLGATATGATLSGLAPGTTYVVSAYAVDAGGFTSAPATTEVGGHGGASGPTVASLISDGEGYCALLSSGGVECWGDNEWGELGDGTSTGPDCNGGCRPTPVGVSDLSSVASLASTGVGDGYCAVLISGGVDCSGGKRRRRARRRLIKWPRDVQRLRLQHGGGPRAGTFLGRESR